MTEEAMLPRFASDSVYILHTVGLSGLEPPTSRLSGVRSNRLSYKPSVNSLLKYLGYFAIRLINASRLFRHVLRTSCPVALALMQVNLHRA